jgi:hypothetical protein
VFPLQPQAGQACRRWIAARGRRHFAAVQPQAGVLSVTLQNYRIFLMKVVFPN